MATINSNYDKFPAGGYLFPEISRRVAQFQKAHPDAKIHRLGIGNTTEPLTSTVIRGLHAGVDRLADVSTYTGYGDEQGNVSLRKAIAEKYQNRGMSIAENEIFVSDGAKTDAANIQSIFGQNNIVAVQDPAYPVYVDSNVIGGRTGIMKDGKYEQIVYMSCNEANGFFPEIPNQKVDLIYICSPNNPTGTVATREQLQGFVDYAITNKAIIIFDSAYSEYISDPSLPRSIYEIPGATQCAIEINSFSKDAGFTGVRLGYTIVPMNLVTEDAPVGRVNALWNRRQTTMFNGASNIVQEGGLAVLSPEGQAECRGLVNYYMGNAELIRSGLMRKGFTIFGGIHSPFIWAKTPGGMPSWEFFDKILTEAGVVVTPGSGFGPSGEGYFRVSAFGHTVNIEAALASIDRNLKI
ncbi:MAG: LL-diaminopimelate aminotransferase [Candidatus Gracilibacteria bacterium]|nr:LL-diaminopimelate aminotransferase [Candidatus Gracilibacteria bacterium]